MLGVRIIRDDGQSEVFLSDHGSVRIGRDPSWANIVLSDHNATIGVGRQHCEFVPGPGCYRLLLNDQNVVWVDGRRAYDGQILPRSCRVSLTRPKGIWPIGKDTGPNSFQCTTLMQDQLETVDIDGGVRGRYDLRIATLMFALVGLASLSIWILWLQSQPVWTELERTQISENVFSVQTKLDGRLSHVGTAWLSQDGSVFTNRHVGDIVRAALERRSRDASAEVFLRLPSNNEKTARLVAIKSVQNHPGEVAFQEFLRKHPVRAFDSRALRLAVYDIASLDLFDEISDRDGLTVASASDIAAMDRGAPLLLVGYPNDVAGNAWDINEPQPSEREGRFSQTRSYFNSPRRPETDPIISYDIKTANGDSGSPVLNSSNEVVAIHFAGAKAVVPLAQPGGLISTTRVAGVGNSFGQSARFLREFDRALTAPYEWQLDEEEAWNIWLASKSSLEEELVHSIDIEEPDGYRCLFRVEANWDDAPIAGRLRKRWERNIRLPTAGRYLIYLQSLNPDGGKIDANIRLLGNGSGSFNPSFHNGGTQLFFHTEGRVESAQPVVSMTMGSINNPYTYYFSIYAWSDSPCSMENFERR